MSAVICFVSQQYRNKARLLIKLKNMTPERIEIEPNTMFVGEQEDREKAKELVETAKYSLEWQENAKEHYSGYFGGENIRLNKIAWYKQVVDRCETIEDKIKDYWDNEHK